MPLTQSYNTLDELFEAMYAMDDDPLANAGTNVVICRGNPAARLLLVGEAPGPQENIQGKPFVGRAGKMLDQILSAADFNSETDVFITNSVFRMPPGEGGKAFRKPSTAEIEAYRPYLLQIIELVDPRIMLLTGNVACQSLLGQTGITKLRGKWMLFNGIDVMPTFHPAYLLRNPSAKKEAWADLQAVLKKLGRTPPPRNKKG